MRFLLVLIVIIMLVWQPLQARTIKIYTYNGPSRKTPKPPPPDTVLDANEMQLGSIAWASVNVDGFRTFAAKPDTFSMFYQFNRKTAYSATDPLAPAWNTSNSFEDGDWTAENDPCPMGWRLPTQTDFQALRDASATNGTWANANSVRGNAVAGRFFGVNHAHCSLPSDMAGCIFLPAVGMRYYNNGNSIPGTLGNQNIAGYYWCSTHGSNSGGYYLSFSSVPDVYGSTTLYPEDKSRGSSIRCVRDL